MKNKILKILLLFILLYTLGGCVSPNPSGTPSHGADLVLRTSVQYGCIRYLSKYPEHIDKAKSLVVEIEAALDQDVEVTLDRLENIVIDSIKWETMTPENKLILSALLSEIKYQVGIRIGDGVLNEDHKVFAKTVLSWIKQSLVMAGA